MLALALVMEGVDRKTAAETCGMDRQTLRDRVHRYNAEGLEGLTNRLSAGPAPRLSPDQKAELARMVREGPRGKPLEVWVQDEARVGQQGTLTRIRAERGTRASAPRDTRHTWACIFGAVCPDHAATAALVLPNTDAHAPELNPIDDVWAYLRANRLAISVFKTYDESVIRCCEAWSFFANDTAIVRSITSRDYAKAVRG